MSERKTMNKLHTHTWCRNCDYHALSREMEHEIIHSTNLNKNITVYCSHCGHKHEMSALEYLKNIKYSYRIYAIERSIEFLDFGNVNMWYVYVNKLITENLIKIEITSENPSMHTIKTLANINLKLDDYIEKILYHLNDLEVVYPKGALKECKDDSYTGRKWEIDTFEIQKFLLKSGLSIWDYPYNLYI